MVEKKLRNKACLKKAVEKANEPAAIHYLLMVGAVVLVAVIVLIIVIPEPESVEQASFEEDHLECAEKELRETEFFYDMTLLEIDMNNKDRFVSISCIELENPNNSFGICKKAVGRERICTSWRVSHKPQSDNGSDKQ